MKTLTHSGLVESAYSTQCSTKWVVLNNSPVIVAAHDDPIDNVNMKSYRRIVDDK